jgi:hypothetical protein
MTAHEQSTPAPVGEQLRILVIDTDTSDELVEDGFNTVEPA